MKIDLQNRSGLLLAFFAGICAAIMLCFTYFWLIAPARFFPKLPDGQYLAEIQWENLRGQHLPAAYLITVTGAEFQLSLPPSYHALQGEEMEILAEGAALGNVVRGSFIESREFRDLYDPLQIPGGDRNFLLYGSEPSKAFSDIEGQPLDSDSCAEDGCIISGLVIEVVSGKTGEWKMIALPEPAMSDTPQAEELQLSLVVEQEFVLGNLTKAQVENRKLINKVEKLEIQLTEVDKLRAVGTQRIEDVRAELNAIQQVSSEILAELKKKAGQLNLAREVTETGGLLEIARHIQAVEEGLLFEDERYSAPEPEYIDEEEFEEGESDGF